MASPSRKRKAPTSITTKKQDEDLGKEEWFGRVDTVPKNAFAPEKLMTAYPRPSRLSETSDESKMLAIRDSLQDRYDQIANIYLMGGWPHSYCYHSGSPPAMAGHHPVRIKKRLKSPEFAPGVDSAWLQLNQREKDKLYLILLSAVLVWEKVYYCDDEEAWMHRNEPPAQDSYGSTLKYYGEMLPAKSVLHFLAQGRSNEEMVQCITNIEQGGLMFHQLDSSWMSALLSGMNSGAGCTAVHKLLEGIATLLCGLETIVPDIPALAVFHITSSTKSDAMSDSSHSLSSKSSRSCSTPDSKRHKPDENHVRNTRKEEEKHDNADIPTACSVVPSHHCLDLSVITRDSQTGMAKYILVVEIHPPGKTFDEANQKFLQEIIFVLQGQNEVFGLFFSTLSVLLYSAKRTEAGEIVIWKEEYSLLEGSRHGNWDNFSVTHFQKLVMDIFSCLIHGIQHIKA